MPSPRIAPLAPCLALVALAACAAAPRAAIAPLEPLRHVEAEMVVRPTERGLERATWEFLSEEQIAASKGLVSIRVRFVELDAKAARERFGDPAAMLVALVVSREQSQTLLDDCADRYPAPGYFSDSMLVLHQEQRGHISAFDQRAYVSSFSIRSNGRTAAADPRVEVATSGVQISATGTADAAGSGVDLELCLEACTFDPEFAQRDLPLAGSHVTLQEPRGLSRNLTTRVTLAPDEALILGGASLTGHHPGRALFALVEAEVGDAMSRGDG